MDLQFEIETDNIRKYDIFWQITNTGLESRRAGQLRGDFYHSVIVEGKRVRKETTLYKGKHYVEAYIVRDGVCYGRSAPFCVVVS